MLVEIPVYNIDEMNFTYKIRDKMPWICNVGCYAMFLSFKMQNMDLIYHRNWSIKNKTELTKFLLLLGKMKSNVFSTVYYHRTHYTNYNSDLFIDGPILETVHNHKLLGYFFSHYWKLVKPVKISVNTKSWKDTWGQLWGH